MRELVHEATRDRAHRRGDATAVRMGNDCLSYAELELRSNRFAQGLLEVGCRQGDRVCLFVPKSPLAATAMVGSLKAGCVYVPIDLASPAPRLAKIVAAADPSAVALTSSAADLLDEVNGVLGGLASAKFIALDAGGGDDDRLEVSLSAGDLAALPDEPLQVHVSPDDAAHILFTSGSTGTPKGVVISHRNILTFLDWAIDYFGIEESDRLSGHAPFHFDLSTFDVYGALTAGSELHLVPPELGLLPRDLAALIDREQLTQWFSVPSVLSYMASFDAVPHGGFPSLRRVVWCGDVLPTPVLIHWMERIAHVQYTNLYGPTETTIASSYYTLTAPPEDATTPIPIGEACAGEELLVLDDDLLPVAPEAAGDLYIGGLGLSRGYWRDDAKTAAAFIDDPRSPQAGPRLYRTGDRARIDSAGLVYFLGRQDSQIKNRGHRIELGEVEAAANAIAAVREAAVVGVASGDFEGTTICCAFAPEEPSGTTSAAVRAAMRKVLPPYMVPTRWLALPALPTNANGKIDRRRLRELFREAHVPKVAREGRAVPRGESG
jgi:amino acid adenylation domain-containing protein